MRTFALFNFLLLLLLTACKNVPNPYTGATWIQNVNVVDPIDGLIQNQTLAIADGKIAELGASSDFTIPKDANVIDGKGKYLIPGLWDAHIHFAYIEELAPYMFNMFLANGVTSVRDTGGKIEFVKKWKKLADENPTTAPRVKIAGPLLDGMPNVYDGSNADRPPLSVGLSNVEAVDQMVDDLVTDGVDLLKAYEMLTPEQFARVNEIGRAKGLKVTGHVPLSMDVIGASNMGMNSMEHLRNLELSCASNSDYLLKQRIKLLFDGKNDPGGILRSRIHNAQRQHAVENFDPDVANTVLETLAKNETWQIPTLTLNTNFALKGFATAEWQEGFKYLPDSLEQLWLAAAKEVSQQDVTPFRMEYKDWQMDMVGKIHDHKIDIMAGTDCPIFFLTPGPSLHYELYMLNQSGLSPQEVLKTATINPARYFNLEDELGTIAENKIADLVLLSANPLEDIRNTQKIVGVMKDGKYYDSKGIEEMVSTINKN